MIIKKLRDIKKRNKIKYAYCIAFDGYLCLEYLRKTKKQSIRALICDDGDRMGWSYQKRENKATCIKVVIKQNG